MNFKKKAEKILSDTLFELYDLQPEKLEVQNTRKEFKGEYTLVTFPLIRQLKKKPEVLGEEIGKHLKDNNLIEDYNVVKGFLNLSFPDAFWLEEFQENAEDTLYGFSQPGPDSRNIMVEYSSPNTNKPLHLGHIRNILLGYSTAQILGAAGNRVQKTQIINDRGIHICKSMIAWQKFGNGETPESANMKGDHLAGKYYVEYDKAYKKEISELKEAGLNEEEAQKQAPIFLEAQEMLRKWEAGDEEVRSLWNKMNGWVYKGFDETYSRLGVDFDHYQYESNTYLLGKDIIEKGLESGVFFKKDDGSVWIDLSDEGLDEKLVLRADGTAVYMTQDLGTAAERFDKFKIDELIYVVGNEQDYHFKVLFLILKNLGFEWAESLHHLSYGMVDLPEGKMKSREGTVVDADDLMEEMYKTAEEISEELGKLDDYTESEKQNLYEDIGLGALKYFILKVDPKKRILFDPKESVDFNGDTGPFIQYAYARICSLLRKEQPSPFSAEGVKITETEKLLIRHLNDFHDAIQKSASELNPGVIANYVYDLVKNFNFFYQNYPVLKADDEATKNFRLLLSQWVSHTISSALSLMGMKAPQKM